MIDIKVPTVGESINEGYISKMAEEGRRLCEQG